MADPGVHQARREGLRGQGRGPDRTGPGDQGRAPGGERLRLPERRGRRPLDAREPPARNGRERHHPERAGDPGPARSRAEQRRDRAAPVHLRGDGEVPRRQPHGQARRATARRGGVRGQQARPDLTGPDLTGPDLTGPDLTGPDLTGPELTGSWPGRAQVMPSPAISLLVYSGHLLLSCRPAWPPGPLCVLAYGLALLRRTRYRATVTAGW